MEFSVRCCAEAATSERAVMVTLTYNSKPENIGGAKWFRQIDVDHFFARLRFYAKEQAAKGFSNGVVRYAGCGETGGKKGRVHWHFILFSDIDWTQVGTWDGYHGRETEPGRIYTPPGMNKGWSFDWSMWPHGFTSIKQADYNTFGYVAGYVNKHQWLVDGSEGTPRERKSHFEGVSKSLVSKFPPLGAAFVARLARDLKRRKIVLPSLSIRVPLRARPWAVSGWHKNMIMLPALAAINAAHRVEHGRDAAGWSSLLHDRRDHEKDMALLSSFFEMNGVICGKSEVDRYVAATALGEVNDLGAFGVQVEGFWQWVDLIADGGGSPKASTLGQHREHA